MRIQMRAAALVMALALTACSTPSSLQVQDGTAHITVPALWAAKAADGSMSGGVELAGIDVSTTSRTPEYSVDLADIEARGAGPAWRAATSMAAAFSTIFVGADPDTVDFHFTITGPIDGPSAGGILTVGIIAAFHGQQLRPGTTMTGTITADGTIGVVGGVKTKIEAAAREGYDTMVVPASLHPGSWNTDNELTTLANSLGVTLVPVFTIADAYAAMTGQPLADLSQIPSRKLDWPASVQVATKETTAQIIDELAARATSYRDLDPRTRDFALESLAAARTDVAAGQTARAYGRAVLALSRISRAHGGATITRIIQTQGNTAARTFIRTSADELLAQSRKALDTSSLVPVRGIEQHAALPIALGWASFTEMTMLGLIADLKVSDPTEADLLEMGRVVEEERLGLDVLLPDAITIVQSVPAQSPTDSAGMSHLMSRYSQFLLRACQAGEDYLTDVLGVSLEDEGAYDSGGYLAGAAAAPMLADSVTPAIDSYPQEAQQFSTALTYYWLVSYALSSIQAYEAQFDTQSDFVEAAQQEAMNNAIDTTWWFVNDHAQTLTQKGLDPSAATWSAAWSTEASLIGRTQGLAAQAGWLAQGELWYDSVEIMMLTSAVSPAKIN